MKKQIKPPYRNYEVNQHKIIAAYKDMAKEGVVLPSYEQIAERSGLSLSTVKRHFANLNFDYICKRERVYTPEVVKAIRDSALDGKARAQKLYAQIMEGYIEKKDHKQEIVGDLKVDSHIEGELKVNVQRGIIKSREDLDRLQVMVRDYKKAKNKVSAENVETSETSNNGDDIFNELIAGSPSVNIDTMLFFK